MFPLLLLLAVAAAAASSNRGGLVVRARRVGPLLKSVPAEAAPGVAVVSRANGWQPVWVDSAKSATMEWGACVWDLKEEQTALAVADEGKAVQAIVNAIGWLTEYVIGIVKAATLDVSICFRVDIPAANWSIGKLSLWTPCEPTGGTGHQLPGWNPDSSRVGWPGVPPTGPVTFEPWPLGEPPSKTQGGAWLRNLGDLYGWGEDVYQLLAPQAGVWKSFPAMRRAGWRRGLVLGGETLASAQGKTGGLVQPFGGGVADYFKRYRCNGQEYKWRLSTRTKAMNRFR